MKELVWFLFIFICMEFVVSKPQNLQDQLRFHLDPLNQPESDYLQKDQGKRTIFPTKHYVFGKHVAIDPHGHRILLGYTPLNVKFPPFLKPVGVFKPLHSNNLLTWRPLKQYLPPALSIHNPVQYSNNNGWKPIISPSILTLSKPELDPLNSGVIKLPPSNPIQPIHSFQNIQPVQTVQSIQPVQHVQPAQPIHFPNINQIQPVRPEHHIHPVHPAQPIQPIHFPNINQIQPVHPAQPIQPIHFPNINQIQPIRPEHHIHPVHPVLPDIKPLLHNYYYFQTPVSKPIIFPQQPIYEVPRPQLPVLPLGAAFPAPVAQPHNVPLVHPHEPTVLQHQPQIPIIHDHHHHTSLFTPSHQLPPQQAVPIPDIHPILHPNVHEQHQPLPPSLSVPVSFPPLTVEFHGNHHLNPFNLNNNSFLLTNMNSPPILYGRHPHQVQFPMHNNEYLPPVTHLQPVRNHHEHLPQEQPQVLFNPAIRPGHHDLHIPEHLPNHPQFSPTMNDHNLFHPFSKNLLKPSISLEAPFTSLQA